MAVTDDVESDVQEGGIREPLVRVDDNLTDGNHGSADGSRGGNQWMLYLSTFVAVCGSYVFGSCSGYSSPTQTAIRKDLGLTLAEYSVFGSILTVGAMIGAITIGPITDFLGRKGALRLSSAFSVAGWLAIYFSKGALSLDIGRLVTGYGMGAFSYVVPVFIAEIAPKHLRGSLTSINLVMICTGVSGSYIIGVLVSWRALALIGLVPCAALIFGLFFIPESPRWLANNGRQKECEIALQKLRGKGSDISHEAAEIQDYIATLDQLPKAKFLDLFQRRYLRSVIIAVGLMVCQQAGGVNAISFYCSSIFELTGFSPKVGTISFSIIQVVVPSICATIMDKVGRKPLILVSASGAALGCMLTAIALFLKVHKLALKASPILGGTGILVYVAFYTIGMGSVPWLMMSEIFPMTIKGPAGSFATLVNWFGAWMCSYTFNYLFSWSSYGTFLLYAATNALAILFVVALVPETKGKTLEQIQGDINK